MYFSYIVTWEKLSNTNVKQLPSSDYFIEDAGNVYSTVETGVPPMELNKCSAVR
jgi:hypothetical protein